MTHFLTWEVTPLIMVFLHRWELKPPMTQITTLWNMLPESYLVIIFDNSQSIGTYDITVLGEAFSDKSSCSFSDRDVRKTVNNILLGNVTPVSPGNY